MRTLESTEPQGHAHAHSRGICARGSRARESAYQPSHRQERARFPAKPTPRAKQGPEGFRQNLQGALALGIPVLSHTRAFWETWVGAHYSSEQALLVAVTADSLRDLKKKKSSPRASSRGCLRFSGLGVMIYLNRFLHCKKTRLGDTDRGLGLGKVHTLPFGVEP